MGRYELMNWKVLLPGALWMLTSLVAISLLSGLQGSAMGDSLFNALRWGPVAMFGWGILLTSNAFYCMWQWQRGEGLLCGCGGMLGHERTGRASRGGAYRKCLACGKNVNHQHYE